MNIQNRQFTARGAVQNRNHLIRFKKGVSNYIYHWPLFLLCIVIATVAAIIFVKITPPVYEIKSTLLIKDSKKTYDRQSALQEIDLTATSKTIENEIELLKSKQLLARVIEDLDLGIDYNLVKRFQDIPMYKDSPVKLVLKSAPDFTGQVKLKIRLTSKTSFALIDESGQASEFSYGDLVRNKAVAWQLIANEQLPKYIGSEIEIHLSDKDKTITRFQRALEVTQVNKLASAILLKIDDQVPQRGRDILNNLVRLYNFTGKEQQNKEVQNTLTFLDRRIDSLNTELTSLETQIAGFKSSKGLTDLNSNSRISLENMQGNDVRLNAVNVQISQIEDISRNINSGRVPTTSGISDPVLSSLIEKLNQLELKRESLLATTPESNPVFEPIARQIRSTRIGIKENVEGIRSALIMTRQKLQSFNNQFEATIKDIPSQEREYISKKRQQAIKENLYTYLLQKREELAVDYASTLSDDRLIDEAYVEPAKIPNKKLIYAIALLFGLCIPALIIFIRENFSDKVKDLDEIRDGLQAPVLVEIPLEMSQKAILVHEKTFSAASEQFRLLRSKLYHLLDTTGGGKVTLLTSSLPGEGKTFVCSNLGVSLAYMEKRTIVLELDLRMPKVAKAFGLIAGPPGVSDYLKGDARLSDIIQSSGLLPNLDVIGSGTATSNPAELFEKAKFSDLITSLREMYDHIIIDSPPVHLVPEALILSRFADLTLYIIRQGVTDKRELSFINELFIENQLNNMHVVFNGVDRKRYGYGYEYNFEYYGNQPKLPTGHSLRQFLTRL